MDPTSSRDGARHDSMEADVAIMSTEQTSHNDSRDPSEPAEDTINAKRKRSMSLVSIKPEKDRSQSPLFEPPAPRQPFLDLEQGDARAEQTAQVAAITDQNSNTLDLEQESARAKQTVEEADITDQNSNISGAKRIATESNAVSSQYRFNRIELDENGCVPGYNVKVERKPQLGVFCPSFQLAELAVTEACDIMITAYAELVENGYHNEEIAVVCGKGGLEACRIPSAYYPAVGPVAVLGPAGSGKSSAINSILSQKKAAFEHDGDDRGTYVPHEYCAAQPDQTSPYRLVAIYYAEDEIERMIIRSFFDIRAYFVESDESNADDSEEALQKQKSDTAIGFFSDLLCSNKEFRCSADTEAWFEKRLGAKHTKQAICGDLVKLVNDFLDSRPMYLDEKEVYDIQDENELHRVFKSVSRPTKVQGLQKPSPWPLLQKVVVHQSVPILDAGVVIADTPGFNDQNLAVVGNTMRYLKQAGTILVFLSYKRIQQNSPLDQLLQECIALGKMHSVRLVVTMIDEMKLHKDDEKDDLEIDEKARLDKAEATLRLVTTELKETEIAKRAAKVSRNHDKFAELDSRLDELQVQKEQATASKLQTCIEVRCRAMQKSLVSRLKNIEKSKYAPDLPITFISNSQYQRHVDGYELGDMPCLDLEATGVPPLRESLYSVPTHGRLQNLKGLGKNRLPRVLMGVEGILFKSYLDRKSNVGRTIKSALEKYDQPAAKIIGQILEAFEKRISKVVKDCLPTWKDEAQRLLSKWGSDVPASTFKAVCQRGGRWDGHKKLGDINWNSSLLKVCKDKLMQGFNRLDDDVEVLRREFAIDVQNTFDHMRKAVELSKDAQGKDLGAFFEFVKITGREVVENMNIEFEVLQASIDEVRHQMTADAGQNYLVTAMKPTYAEAALLTAKNSLPASAVKDPSGKKRKRAPKQAPVHGARQHVLFSTLRGEDGKDCVFKKVKELGQADLKALLSMCADACNGIVQDGSNEILAHFDRSFKDTEEASKEDPVAIEKLKEAMDRAMQVTESIKDHLDACDAYEQGR